MKADPAPPVSRAALASALLGLAALTPLLALAGVPALLLGLAGLRAVNAGEGRLRGRRLALAGMGLGGLGTLVTAAGVAALLAIQLGLVSRRAACLDGLRRVGVGLGRYHETHKTFPPAGLPAPGLEPEERLSWLAGILPFVGEGRSAPDAANLAARLDPAASWRAPSNAAARDTPTRQFLCPADPAFGSGVTPSPTNYVGLAGVGPGAVALPRSSPRAGPFGYDRGVSREEMTRGTGYTLMVAETAREPGPWLASGPPTARDLDPADDRLVGPGRAFGGLHPGGMNVLYGDLSGRWLTDGVDAAFLRRQVLLDGREPAGP